MARTIAKTPSKALKLKPQDEAVTPEQIFKLGFAFWGSKTLLSAIGMGLFTEIGDQKVHLDEISQRLGLHGRSARDFLDALVALGMLEREGAHHFANTPATAQYLDRR